MEISKKEKGNRNMRKQNIFLLIGITWMLCCVYQLKNGNKFMAVVSAVISVLLFALAIYNKIKSKPELFMTPQIQ